MFVRFTNTDSTGTPVTESLTVTIDGESHEIDVADTGTARVPEHVGEYLIESDAAVVPYDGADDSDESVEAAARAAVLADEDEDEDDDGAGE